MFSFPAFSLAVCWLGVVHAQAHLCRKKDGWIVNLKGNTKGKLLPLKPYF